MNTPDARTGDAATETEFVAPLRRGFRLTKTVTDWRIVCRACGQAWRLPRTN